MRLEQTAIIDVMRHLRRARSILEPMRDAVA
jgi:hypothetical protein